MTLIGIIGQRNGCRLRITHLNPATGMQRIIVLHDCECDYILTYFLNYFKDKLCVCTIFFSKQRQTMFCINDAQTLKNYLRAQIDTYYPLFNFDEVGRQTVFGYKMFSTNTDTVEVQSMNFSIEATADTYMATVLFTLEKLEPNQLISARNAGTRDAADALVAIQTPGATKYKNIMRF